MQSNIAFFIGSLRNESNSDLINIIMESISVIFEGPHIDASKNQRIQMFHNLFNPEDVKEAQSNFKNKFQMLPKDVKAKFVKPILTLMDIDAIDLYVEEEGALRQDGKIHEPIRYIRDIIDGNMVISPRDNVPIQLSKSDGKTFQSWVVENPIAMMEINSILERNPERANILPFSFYNDAIKANTMTSDFIQQLFPAPVGMHESISDLLS